MNIQLSEILNLVNTKMKMDIDIFSKSISFHGAMLDKNGSRNEKTWTFIKEHMNDYVRGVRFEDNCLYVELKRDCI